MSAEPIVISDDDDEGDDLLDFFTVKKHFKPIPLADLDGPEAGPSDYSSDEEGTKRKRRRTRKQPTRHRSTLPEWTRGSVSGTRASGEVDEKRPRKSSEPASLIVISDDGDGDDDDGQGDQARVELTPPPKLSAAKQAEIRAEIARHTAATQPAAPQTPIDLVSEASSPPPEPGRKRERIRVNVRMIADGIPEGASQTAVRQYEKRRTITIFRDQKVDVLWHTVASRISCDADDLVFVHDGHKIYSRHQTARQLLIDDEAEIAGYQKAHWDRLQQEKKEDLRRQLAGPGAEFLLEEEGGGQGSQQTGQGSRAAQTAAAEQPVQEKRTKISLRAASGTYRVKVAGYVTGATLAEVYCRKAGRQVGEAKGLRLVFDGERIEGGTTVGELDVEDGDIIDVEG